MILPSQERFPCRLVDLTGGAPELNPFFFRRVVTALREKGGAVQAWTNLVLPIEPGGRDLPAFFRANRVEGVASLACHRAGNVFFQQGEGGFEGSVEAIRRLQALGCGPDADLPLSLGYNPCRPLPPPSQSFHEEDGRRELAAEFGVIFTCGLTLTGMPLGRFREALRHRGEPEGCPRLLRASSPPR